MRLDERIGSWSEAEIIAASAKHPFDHIQYGVSSLLSGQSSATGDPRAGAYYFPAWEIPDAMGKHPNKYGKHYLYEFGLKARLTSSPVSTHPAIICEPKPPPFIRDCFKGYGPLTTYVCSHHHLRNVCSLTTDA